MDSDAWAADNPPLLGGLFARFVNWFTKPSPGASMPGSRSDALVRSGASGTGKLSLR